MQRPSLLPAQAWELPLSSPTFCAKQWQLVVASVTEAKCPVRKELRVLGKFRIDPDRLGWDKGTFGLRLMSEATC